mgnify:CR=1 FL=1
MFLKLYNYFVRGIFIFLFIKEDMEIDIRFKSKRKTENLINGKEHS